MKEKKDVIPDRFPNMSATLMTSTVEIPYDYNNSSNFNNKKFTKETKIHYSKYESFNVVSENGDSIYSPEYEEFTTLDNISFRDQIFISETAIEEIVDRIIDQRLGLFINNNKENG
jgi:hypothetical protein